MQTQNLWSGCVFESFAEQSNGRCDPFGTHLPEKEGESKRKNDHTTKIGKSKFPLVLDPAKKGKREGARQAKGGAEQASKRIEEMEQQQQDEQQELL